MKEPIRCEWCLGVPAMIRYHDNEWGVPVHDDRLLFEFLILEGAQAGLSWLTALKRRESYRAAFDGFDPRLVALYDESKHECLMHNPGVIRNRLKIASPVRNARVFLRVQEQFGSFSRYLWAFVDGRPIVNRLPTLRELPARTRLSDRISRDLQKRGFTFVGFTICYAFLQAVGVVNDHTEGCFRAL